MGRKRVLCFILSLALALSCIGSIPAKAAGNEMSVASVFNFGTSNGDWRFNFNMDGTWPTDGSFEKYSATFSVEIKDASGNVLDTPASDAISNYKNGSYWMLCIWGTYTANNAPNDGDTVTISSGQMAYTDDASKVVAFSKECVLKWNATTSAWEVVIVVETVPGKLTLVGAATAGTNWPGGTSASAIYLHSDDTITPYTDWSVISSPLNAEDGIYLNGTRAEKGQMKKFATGAWYAEGLGTAVAGDIVTIKGVFGNETTGEYVEMAESQFRWNGEYWEEYIATPDETGKVFSRVSSSDNTAKTVVLVGDDTLGAGTSWVPFTVGTDGGDGNGIFYNGTKTYIPLKRIGAGRYYVALGDVDITAVEGDILTVKGVFTNSYYSATYEKASFIFDGSTWSLKEQEMEYTDINITKLESTNIGTDSVGKPFWDLYFKIDADAPGENWATTYDDLVVMANDTQISAGIKRANNAKQLNIFIWGSELSTTPEVGTRLTIKAGQSLGYALSDGTPIGSGINLLVDYTLEWDGSAWVLPTEYTSITITGINVNTAPKDSSEKWQAYLQTDATLPGESWGVVDNQQEGYNLVLDVDGTEHTVWARKADGNNLLYIEIPYDVLPKDTVASITFKAGKYKSNLQYIGLNLTADFAIYTTPYGWTTTADSFEESVWLALDSGNDNSKKANGFVVTVNRDDGVASDASGWTSRIFPAYEKNVTEDQQMLYFAGENGVSKNGEYQAVKVPMVKIGTYTYYVAISDVGLAAEADDYYTVGGGFMDFTTGRFIEFEPLTVKWDGTAWSVVETDLGDAGVTSDVNADAKVDSRDLVRIARYLDNRGIAINAAQKDVNYSGAVDAKDAQSMRKILVGMIYYKDGVVCGTPIYKEDKVIERSAFSSPSVGTIGDGGAFTSQLSDAEINAAFQKYKAAGFTLLNSEFVAVYKDQAFDSEYNKPLRVYLEAAERNGLGVLVFSDFISAAIQSADIDAYSSNWKGVLDYMISMLSAYDSFRGFMLTDECEIGELSNYAKLTSYLHENYPELILHCAMFPVSAYESDPNMLTTDTTTNNTEELAYRDYVYNFSKDSGIFNYDLYALIYSKNWISSSYSVNSKWYDNLKYVAEERKEQDYSFSTSITIQSCGISGTESLLSKYERYVPDTKADMGFQTYTALAYGMQSFHYFTYADHPTDGNVNGAMADNSDVYAAVKNVNADVDTFAHAYMAFDWKDTLDISTGASASTALSSRLASASVSGSSARAFVGCMKDSDGVDGYMVANATGPREDITTTVTLTFNHATKAIVYADGQVSTVSLTDGVYTVSVGAGEGVFVIPLGE